MYNLYVYGTLKQGYINHSLLYSSIFLGKVETVERYVLTDIGLPILIDYQGDNSRNIEGELYFISTETLNRIDFLEGHPHLYKRKEIKVRNYQTNKEENALCYFYNANPFAIEHAKYIESKKIW